MVPIGQGTSGGGGGGDGVGGASDSVGLPFSVGLGCRSGRCHRKPVS